MKYDDKYPDASFGVEQLFGVIKMAGNPHPCWHCGEPTNWWDIAYGTPICSEECLTAKDKEAERVCKKSSE